MKEDHNLKKLGTTFSRSETTKIFAVLGVLCLFMYWNFLSLNKLYVYVDSGADTINSYWPMLSHLMYTLKSGELPFWSFNMGMGMDMYTSNIFIGDVINYLLIFVPNEDIAYAFGYIAVFKIMLSSFIFYKLIVRFNISFFSVLIGTILFGLNGYMILWGQHYQFANVMIYFPLLILSFERLIINKQQKLFVFTVFLIAIYSYYFLFIMTIFLFIYASLRYLTFEKKNWEGYIRLVFKAVGNYIIGIMIAGFILIPTVVYVLSSPRINGSVSPTMFDSISYYVTSYFRLFSNNTVGIGSDFLGVIFYYDAPIFYSSILCLLLIPQFFVTYSKKYTISVIILYVILIVFAIFPFFSIMLNAFSKLYYRWTFVIVFFNILFSVFALDRIIKNKLLNLKLLLLTSSTFIVLGILAYIVSIRTLNWSMEGIPNHFIVLSLVFLILYTVLLGFMKKIDNTFYFKSGILLLLCFELFLNNSPSINDRPTVDADYVQNKQGYFDDTRAAIEDIKQNDSSFYRINKNYDSVHLNDALIQNYNGFDSYNSLNSPSYITFLEYMNISMGMGNLLISGLDNRMYLETLMSQKYLLAKDNKSIPYGYVFKNNVNDIQVYENKYWLPLGVTYDKFISKEQFLTFNNEQKDVAMLQGAVIDKSTEKNIKLEPLSLNQINERSTSVKGGLKQSSNLNVSENKFPSFLKITATNNDPNLVIKLEKKYSGFFTLHFTASSEDKSEGQIFWSGDNSFNEADSQKISIQEGTNDYEVNLGYISDISSIRLDIANIPGIYTIQDFKLQYKTIDSEYSKYVSNLKKESMVLEKVSNNSLSGNITIDHAKLLFLSIPYDKGWKVKIDGKEAELINVNLGFMGVELQEGNHKIELKYTPPGLWLGLIISCLGLLFCAVICGYKFYKRRYK